MFMAVVLSESERFMLSLQGKVKAEAGTMNKVMRYLSERMRYYKDVINLHQLSIERLRQIGPVFDELYGIVRAKERAFLKHLLDEGVRKGELKAVDTEKVAAGLITLNAAIKHEGYLGSDQRFVEEVDFEPIAAQNRFMVQLIFDGLHK